MFKTNSRCLPNLGQKEEAHLSLRKINAALESLLLFLVGADLIRAFFLQNGLNNALCHVEFAHAVL